MTREELSQAFADVVSMEFAEIPLDENSIEYTFSDSFLQKMDKLLRKQTKLYWNLFNTASKRVAVIVIVFVTLMTTACSVDSIREPILRWCTEIFEEYIYHFFEGETTKEISQEYQLVNVPEGFHMVQEIRNVKFIEISYENENGDCIDFSQYTTEEYQFVVDNEQVKESTMLIRNLEVKIFEHESLIGAMWIENGYYMSLTYHGCDNVDVIKKMIEAIQLK